MKKSIDLTGMEFGRWIVLGLDKETTEKHNNHDKYWICQCSCEQKTIKTIIGLGLKNGTSKSCGCLRKEIMSQREVKNKIHGKWNTKIYQCWADMKQRCYNPKNKSYVNYGARGIGICEEWKNNFQLFYDWAITNGYSEDLTIDRINNDKDYFPENCRWAGFTLQNINQRQNKIRHSSPYIGVSFHKKSKKWRAQISINNKKTCLGFYLNIEDAKKAREEAELQYFGKDLELVLKVGGSNE
jgi:hypothetical protein